MTVVSGRHPERFPGERFDPQSSLRYRSAGPCSQSLLIEKGYVDLAAVDALIDTYETKIGPRNGAKVVAKAWSDNDFVQWLRDDANAAIASLDLQNSRPTTWAVGSTSSQLGPISAHRCLTSTPRRIANVVS
jgi:Nitrile hydratase, alpha chain